MREFGSPIFNVFFFKVKADLHKRRSSFLVDQVRTCTFLDSGSSKKMHVILLLKLFTINFEGTLDFSKYFLEL